MATVDLPVSCFSAAVDPDQISGTSQVSGLTEFYRVHSRCLGNAILIVTEATSARPKGARPVVQTTDFELLGL